MLVHIPAVSCVPPIRLITHQFRIAIGRLVTAARSGAPAGGASRGRTAEPLRLEPGGPLAEICLALAGTSSRWAELPALVVCARESPPTPLRLDQPIHWLPHSDPLLRRARGYCMWLRPASRNALRLPLSPSPPTRRLLGWQPIALHLAERSGDR